MKKFFTALLSAALLLTALVGCGSGGEEKKSDAAASLEAGYLEKANAVVVNEDSVTFTDASGDGTSEITIQKNPQKVANLYGSYTTLWYEAGGTVAGCIGGKSSTALYQEYIGRDITQDEGMMVLAESSSGKKWNTEGILALQPDLIICSTAMSGYATMEAPAKAADIPLIAVEYNDFSDYLKWFKVFCNLTGHPELWDSVALPALNQVVSVLEKSPTENNPKVFCMFAGSKSLQANTSETVVGGMITELHAVNIVDAWENASGEERLDINLETVVAADPDMIFVQCHAGTEEAEKQVAEQYGDDPVWQSLRAVKEGKIFYLEKTLFHNKPNSRFAEAYTKLSELLYPAE